MERNGATLVPTGPPPRAAPQSPVAGEATASAVCETSSKCKCVRPRSRHAARGPDHRPHLTQYVQIDTHLLMGTIPGLDAQERHKLHKLFMARPRREYFHVPVMIAAYCLESGA
eukprot:scaffold163244_cov25-Tisochrysis_lutea.AAC.2